jgi:hypothetical protein
VVFFKLQLIMFFEGIRSERQLMELVNLNLAYRWYIGYDLDEPVPDHSSLSKIRDRYGLVVFQRFFEGIVELCQTAGLVWGQELYFDGTKIRANAALEGTVPRWYWEAKHHLRMSRFRGDRAKLGYHTHYVVDGGQSAGHPGGVSHASFDYGPHPDAGSRLLGALSLASAAQDCGGRHQVRHCGEYCWSSPAGHSSLSADP